MSEQNTNVKIHAVSDLHAEHFKEKTQEAQLKEFAETLVSGKPDIIILAGDIHQRDRGVTWAAEMMNPQKTGIPVIIIAWNHEFYSNWRYDKIIRESRKTAKENEGIHFLDATGSSPDQMVRVKPQSRPPASGSPEPPCGRMAASGSRTPWMN